MMRILAVGILIIAGSVLAQAQRDPLPPGVPNPLRPDGRYSYEGKMFTTKAYAREAFRLVLAEANVAAKELDLEPKMPITEDDLMEAYITTFGDSYVNQRIGNVSTRRYAYYVSRGNKLSFVEGKHQTADCLNWVDEYNLLKWPKSRTDTNAAYQLATQWLAALSMDVNALNKDCKVTAKLHEYWNERMPRRTIVPIYEIYWTSPAPNPRTRLKVPNRVAEVELYLPEKRLLSLRVEDPKYILRPPLVFTNLAELLSPTNAVNAASPPGN